MARRRNGRWRLPEFSMRNPLAIVLGVAVGLIVLVYGVILWLESSSGQRWIERRASAATGREILIGDLDIRVGFRPGLRVERLRITNPEWAKSDHLANLEVIELRLRLLPLLTARAVIEELTLVQARFGIEREENRNTWTFREREQTRDDGPQRVFVHRINIDRGHVIYRDTLTRSDLAIDVTGDIGGGGGIDGVAQGRFRGVKTPAVARIPGLLPTPDTAVDISAAGTFGSVTAAAAGTVRAANVDGVDLDVDISGGSLIDLDALLGVNLPKTPPYRLQGRFRNPRDAFSVESLSARIGDSDIAGAVSYTRTRERPLLSANLRSELVDFDDLGPLVGAPPKSGPGETASQKQQAQAAQMKHEGRVLPQVSFEVERWPAMDADVRYEVRRIVDTGQVPIENLFVHWIMDAGVLRLEPLRFRMASGNINANLSLDGRAKPARAQARIDVTGLNLRQLFPKPDPAKDPLGVMNGRIDLTGRGTSIADLFGTGNGRLALMVNGGYVSHLLVEVAGLDVAQALMVLATRDTHLRLRCAVADFAVENGIARPNAFVIDTTDTIISVSGNVNFKNESMDLLTSVEPKDVSPFALRTPVRIHGTLREPKIAPKAGPIVARGAAALLLGLVNPLLAIVPFVDVGTGEDADCGALLAQVRGAGAKVPPKR